MKNTKIKMDQILQPLYRLKEHFRPGWQRFCTSMTNHWVRCLVIAAIMTFVADVLNLRSVGGALLRLVTYPQLVLINYLLILLPLTISCLFRKQLFATFLCALPWTIIVIVNFGVQSYRFTPLTAVDFALIPSFLGILDYYFTTWQIVFFGFALVLAIAFLVLLYRKSKKHPRQLRQGLILAGVSAALIAALLPLFLYAGVLSTRVLNMKKAYRDYGLPYGFLLTVFDRGIAEPEDYSDEAVDRIWNEIGNDDPATVEERPNVIFLQLESFMDARHLKQLEYSQNPTPYFQELKKNYPSGYLTVPTYGAGTVNTEFEILTGMSLSYFGAGEYPYISVLLDQTCETVAYNLKENGYYATAIHNNTATFYDRDLVFANMGFDRFVAEEFMQDLTYTPVGWPKDTVLLPEIERTLTETAGPDLIYAISVQPHGKYPSDLEDVADCPIEITQGPQEESLQAGFTYYINQLNEVDSFLHTLTQTLEQWDEPVMLVIFGDHLPNFVLEEEDLKSRDLFKTEYVIWTNYQLTLEDENLYAYQLSSRVLQGMNCRTGVLNRLHQTRETNDDYQSMLELVQYDILYGQKKLYDGENPYRSTALQLGYGDLKITDCQGRGGILTVQGEGFTESSVVYYAGEEQETVLTDDGTLQVKEDLPPWGAEITVRQVAANGKELASSPVFIWER